MPRLILSTRTIPTNPACWVRSARLMIPTFAVREDSARAEIASTGDEEYENFAAAAARLSRRPQFIK